jgi:hypothetical protein
MSRGDDKLHSSTAKITNMPILNVPKLAGAVMDLQEPP